MAARILVVDDSLTVRMDLVARARLLLRRDSDVPSGTNRVLVVDDSTDSPTYLDLVVSALHGEGYQVILAHSGEEALELLSVERVDCILLDLVLPGIGGEETCRRIKAATPMREVPVIMLTASEDRDAMLRGLGAGADDYIQKTSDFEVLRARIRAQIRRRQFEDEDRSSRDQLLQSRLEATEARAARELAETRASLVEKLERSNERLERANQELEAFSYSVSHDLRAPLRAIDGFSRILLENHHESLDAVGRQHLGRVRAAALRMGELIDDLLSLSRVGRVELRRTTVDLSATARAITDALREKSPSRCVDVSIDDGIVAHADRDLARVVLENVLSNAWKFTGGRDAARIAFRSRIEGDVVVYSVEDDGAGFEPSAASRLFKPFQRLHTEREFAGTGIGLATVRRIVERHAGRVSATGAVGKGATIEWTFGTADSDA